MRYIVFSLFSKFQLSRCRNDEKKWIRPTDKWTGGRTDGQTDDGTKSIVHIFQKCALKTYLVLRPFKGALTSSIPITETQIMLFIFLGEDGRTDAITISVEPIVLKMCSKNFRLLREICFDTSSVPMKARKLKFWLP
jgi:hypothetical protein